MSNPKTIEHSGTPLSEKQRSTPDPSARITFWIFVSLFLLAFVQEGWKEILPILYVIWTGIFWFFKKTGWAFIGIFGLYIMGQIVGQIVYRSTMRALQDFNNRYIP